MAIVRPDGPGRAFVHTLVPHLVPGTRVALLMTDEDNARNWIVDGIILRVIAMETARNTGHPAGYETRLVGEPSLLPPCRRSVTDWCSPPPTVNLRLPEPPTAANWPEHGTSTTGPSIAPSSVWGGGSDQGPPPNRNTKMDRPKTEAMASEEAWAKDVTATEYYLDGDDEPCTARSPSPLPTAHLSWASAVPENTVTAPRKSTPPNLPKFPAP